MVDGYFTSLDCGTGTYTAASLHDPFALRFAVADGAVSLRTWGPTGDNYVEGGASDQLGAQVLTGNTSAPWTWNGHALSGGAFIAKAQTGSGIAWALAPGNGLVFQVVADDKIAVAANCTGGFDFGGGPLSPIGLGSTDDICLASLSLAGGELWAKRIGSGSEMSASSIAMDRTSGETFLLGHAASGNTPVDTLMGTETDFLAAFDDTGKAEWIDSLTFDLSAGIATNKKYVALAGSFQNPANIFGPRQPTVAGVSDSFVVVIQR